MVGYLLEELRGEKNYNAFKKDVAAANIFLASLIFIEELADKVRESPTPMHLSQYSTGHMGRLCTELNGFCV